MVKPISQINIGGVSAEIADATARSEKVDKSGDTMTGQLRTSFHSSVAVGSYGSSASTIPDLCEELRYSSGCMGSVNITTAYTNNITIPVGWYNFIWAPHRTGGTNGTAQGDNCNYGTLYLNGMTVDAGPFCIRYASEAIASVKNLSQSVWG